MQNKIIPILLSLIISSTGLTAAEKTILSINFNRPVWKEIFTHVRGASANVTNGVLHFSSPGSTESCLFDYYPGTTITVAVRIKSSGIKQGTYRWQAGRVILQGFNAAHKEICHFDIATIHGNTDWKIYTADNVFSDSIKFFTINLANTGKSGQIWFDDLKVSVRNKNMVNLIGDSGFEGNLGADHWFPRRQGVDWDKLMYWESSSTIEIDTNQAVVGKQSVKLTGASTLMSRRFDYHGEPMILSGWVRTQDITVGARKWCKALIQIVGYDAAGSVLLHTDLLRQAGTKPWAFYQKEVRFPLGVKQVQVLIRIFEGATGIAWFDEVMLQSISTGKDLVPFNAMSATLQIDAGSPGDLIKHRVWSGVDVSYISRLIPQDQKNDLVLLKKIGIKMIRVRELGPSSLGSYNKDDPKTGKPIYNWDRLDALFDLLVRHYQFIPNVTLESTPPALARKGTPTNKHCNRWPPTDYDKWGKFIEAFMDHVIERYGKEEVQKWYWEVWNEPMAELYYKGTPEEFVRIAEQAYSASERVEKRHGINLKMGLTSGGKWMNDYVLDYLKNAGKLHLIEHYTEHFYLGARTPLHVITGEIAAMKRLLKSYPGVGDCELGSTEWNSNSMAGEFVQNSWNAACAVKTVRLMLDAGLDYSTFFCFREFPYRGDKSPTFRNLGMIALNGVPKPVYNAFLFLNELTGGRRLKVVSSNDPMDGLAVRMPDGSIRILITNYDEDIARQPYETKVALEITGAAGKGYRCTRRWVADEVHGNSYGKWVELGKPPASDAHAKVEMLQASQYGVLDPVAVTDSKGLLRLTLTVPSPGIQLIELQPAKHPIEF